MKGNTLCIPLNRLSMKAISDIYLNAVASGVSKIEQESLSEEEITLIDHFLK
jgi:hypothetical protein